MASESNRITVTVKTLVGDLLSVEVEAHFMKWHYPHLNRYPVMHDLKYAMNTIDPIAYPALRSTYTLVSKEDEEVKEATDETRIHQDEMFFLFVKPEPMCQLIQQDEVTLPHINASREESFIHWHFRLENEEDCHVYLRYDESIRQQIASSMNSPPGPMTQFDITYQMPMRVSRGFSYRSIHHMLNGSSEFMNVRDAHVIRAVLQKTMPAGFEMEQYVLKECFCECGFVVDYKKMRAHLNTKHKHKNGDPCGKDFLSKTQVYVDSL